MTLLEQMLTRQTELRAQADSLFVQRGAIIDKAAAEKRGVTDAEQTTYDDLTSQRSALLDRDLPMIEQRVEELRALEQQDQAAAAVRQTEARSTPGAGPTVSAGAARVEDPPVYVRGGGTGNSYFRDLARSQFDGDRDARDRLVRNGKALEAEQRALGNTNTTGGSGGEFAPPAWMVQDYIALARAGRATADLYQKSPVPAGVSSVNLPRIVTGTTAAIQTTQNTALSQTDITTAFVGTGFTTVGGKQVVAQQLLDQTAIDFDKVILTDLAGDYARAIGAAILSGTGTGANNNSVVNGLANAGVLAANQAVYTSASPTAAGFYSKAAGMVSSFVTNRYVEPTVWVMHPRRWYWLLAQSDSSGRPLVTPVATVVSGNHFGNNELATAGMPVAQGVVGIFLGLPVVIDPQVPTNQGAGTNQDEVFLLNANDLWLFESPVQAEVFRQPYADSMGVLFRMFAYVGTILNRYNSSIATLTGTGLVAPTF